MASFSKKWAAREVDISNLTNPGIITSNSNSTNIYVVDERRIQVLNSDLSFATYLESMTVAKSLPKSL